MSDGGLMPGFLWVANVAHNEVAEWRRITPYELTEGPPNPSGVFSCDELTALGYVGLYRRVN